MPEQTDPVLDEKARNASDDFQSNIDLNALAEMIVELIMRELEIENHRTGRRD